MIRTEDDLRAAYEVFGPADADRSIDRHAQLVRELSGAPVSKRHRRWLAPALSAAAVVAVIGGIAAAGVLSGSNHTPQPAGSTAAPVPVPRYLGPIKTTKNYIHLDLILSPPGGRTPALSPARAVSIWCADLTRLLRRAPASLPKTCTPPNVGATMVYGSGRGYYGVPYGNPGSIYVIAWTQAPCDLHAPSDVEFRRCTGEAAINATTGAPLGEIMLTSQSRPEVGLLLYSARFGTHWPPTSSKTGH